MLLPDLMGNDATFALLYWSLASVIVLLGSIIVVILILRLHNNHLDRSIKRFTPLFVALCSTIESNAYSTDSVRNKLVPGVFPFFERFLRDKIADISEVTVNNYRTVSEQSGFSGYLRRIIQKKRGWRRAIALRTLTYLRNPSDVLLFQRILKQDTFYPSVFAAGLGLALCKDTQSFNVIINRLCALKTENRDDILIILTAFGSEVCPCILEHLVKLTDATQTVLIDFMRLDGYRQAKTLLEEIVMTARGLEVRIHTIEALGVLGDHDSLLLLQPFLMDEDFRIRLKTVVALSKIGGKEYLPSLITMLDDPDWWVRRNAAEAVYGLGDVGIAELTSIGAQGETMRSRMARMVLDELGYDRIRWRYRFAESFS